jgi:hypothetical protein
MRADEIGEVHSTKGREQKFMQSFDRKPEAKIPFANLGITWMIIF